MFFDIILLEFIFKSDIRQLILNELHGCLVTCFPLNVPHGENPLSKLTRCTLSLDLDYLGIEQLNLVKYPYLFLSRSIDMFLVGRTHTYCLPECSPMSQPHLAPVCAHGTPSWGGPNHAHTMHKDCPMDHSPWITIMVLMFLVGRTHHHYNPVNGPLETMGIDYSL